MTLRTWTAAALGLTLPAGLLAWLYAGDWRHAAAGAVLALTGAVLGTDRQAARLRRRAGCEYAILGALATEGPMGGYDLTRCTGMPSGALYPALRRLECQGRITGAWHDAGQDAPERRMYTLTRPWPDREQL